MSAHGLARLAWDSEFLGFPVARIEGPDLDDEGLSTTLWDARSDRFRLIYWATHAGRNVPETLLREFSGVLADRRATYSLDLSSPGAVVPASDIVVSEYPSGPASPRLHELAITAGAYSRFQRDPLFPLESFRSLYRTWIHRCAVGELADAVLVASSPGMGPPLGMVTISVRDRVGQIGLIAVAEDARGRGVGARLVDGAHERMRRLGAGRAVIVTQLDNAPACRLYEHLGYRLSEVRQTYHFWPLNAADPARDQRRDGRPQRPGPGEGGVALQTTNGVSSW
jgi:dTDP-4-amino-4,6-dideoxy-D-galactose acyltransferase